MNIECWEDIKLKSSNNSKGGVIVPKIFLASTYSVKSVLMNKATPHYLLESFYKLKSMSSVMDEYIEWTATSDGFLLDSGAFTFMNSSRSHKNMNLDDYIQRYIEFINRHKIDNFFEMDLDCMMDYEEVKKLRDKIEKGTNKQCIPVWHKSRGKEEFLDMCKEYDYVAIGGIASREIKKTEWEEILIKLCDVAHKNNCKIHGLGFLSLEWLNNDKCPFDTVDGTAWMGSKTGHSFIINENKELVKIKDDRNWRESIRSCFDTWNDFCYIKEGLK